jgi:hypothetical protein
MGGDLIDYVIAGEIALAGGRQTARLDPCGHPDELGALLRGLQPRGVNDFWRRR